jgi:putative selenium metabolism protein SsnA
MTMPHSLLLINGLLADPASPHRVLRDHALLIEEDRIARIAPRASFASAEVKTIDAQGKLVLPGFINAHTHLYSTFACGLSGVENSRDFLGILNHLWWRLDKALTLDDCYLSALPALLAAIRSGTTTLIDHHASPMAIPGSLEALARAVGQTGLRACLCYEVSDRDGEEKTAEGIEENRSYLNNCKASPQDYLRGLFGLHASFTLSDRTLEIAADVAAGLRTGVHIHVAESTSDQEISKAKYGRTAVERLQKFNLLGPDTIAAHCVHLSDMETEILASSGTMIVHNPQSNLNNAVGIADVGRYIKRGITVGLGTDAMTPDMREELRAGVWAQRIGQKNPSAGFMELTSTLWCGNPAIATRLWGTPVGTLREGSLADIVIFDYTPPTPVTDDSLLGHLVFGMMNGCVETTIVGGKILMENRELRIDIDEEEVMARAREAAERVWRRF